MKDLLNKEIEKICRKNKLMGANVVLFDKDQIVYGYYYGYANKEQNRKSTKESLYMIGSNTKVMTAICILKLMEEGILSLDDDIRKFIPEFEVMSTFDYDKITIGNLLMHRSGLVGDIYSLILDRTRDFHEVISELKNTYLTAMPGAMFAYSNVGYTVLGIIIERASGLTYQEYIEKTIARPLGIGIHFWQSEEERGSYEEVVSLCYNKKGCATEEPLCTMIPAGSGTYMSIEDFVKFGQIFLKRDNTILKKETLALMETLECPEEIDKELGNGGYGLLHNIYNMGESVGKILGHGGDTMYHHSIFYYIPGHNIGVAVFANSEQAPNAVGMMADKAIISYLAEKGITVEKNSFIYNHCSGECAKYEGQYISPLGMSEIKAGGKGTLVTKIKGLSVSLQLCEDGFWEICPKNLLLQLPPLKNELKKVRVKFSVYDGKDVILMEQRDEYSKLQMIFGCRYEEAKIPKSFVNACGQYKIVNENLQDKGGSGRLCIKDNALVLKVKFIGTKGSACLRAVSHNLAFVDGYGRGTGNDVVLREDADGLYLSWCGLIFRKIRK